MTEAIQEFFSFSVESAVGLFSHISCAFHIAEPGHAFAHLTQLFIVPV
jgi:hypothetical protein